MKPLRQRFGVSGVFRPPHFPLALADRRTAGARRFGSSDDGRRSWRARRAGRLPDDAIHLAGLDERSNDGPVFTTPIRFCKKMILPAKCNRAHCAFDNIGIDFDATVIKEAREPFPA
jgi:hypothetical protein